MLAGKRVVMRGSPRGWSPVKVFINITRVRVNYLLNFCPLRRFSIDFAKSTARGPLPTGLYGFPAIAWDSKRGAFYALCPAVPDSGPQYLLLDHHRHGDGQL